MHGRGSGPRRLRIAAALLLIGVAAAGWTADTEVTFDLSQKNLAGRRPVALDGTWAWYPNRLLTHAPADREARSVNIPTSLSPTESQGAGTLIVTVDLPPGGRSYGLKIPYMASANRVYVDGQEIGGAGSVEAPYRARYLPLELFFDADGGPVELAIQVANEHHRRMRLNRVYIGEAPTIRRLTHLRLIRDAVLFGSLALLAAYHLVVFFLHQRDRAFLFFAGIAGVAAMRLGITTERVLVRVWPAMPPELMMKFGYAPAFLLLPLIVLYLHQLSPFGTLQSAARVARIVASGFALLILVTTVQIYDWVFEYALLPIVALGLYVLVLVILRPTFDSRSGANVIAVGGVIVLVTAVSDYLREIGVLQAPELLSVGILVFLLLQAYFLAWRFQSAYTDISELAGEVQRLNRDLEERIEERTRELAAANERLRQISRTDGLTGIANRRYFDEAYEREWQHAVRYSTPIAAILADIDFFKAYNDHAGHLEGDDCLRRIAGILQTGARRRTDVVARYGGEEFMILLPDAELEIAVSVAEDLRGRVMALGIPHPDSEVAEAVTVSFGVAMMRPGGEDEPASLLRQADTALYRAKERGRNRVVAAT